MTDPYLNRLAKTLGYYWYNNSEYYRTPEEALSEILSELVFMCEERKRSFGEDSLDFLKSLVGNY